MKTIQKEFYQCEKCNKEYSRESLATKCESQPIMEVKDGVKIGGKVKIIQGDGTGEMATVTKIFVMDMDWGHYQWEKYWHTIALSADLEGGGSRLLTFDSYEV